MESNQAVAHDNTDNVVPLSGPTGSKNSWIYENLKNLFDHFSQVKADTDERLAVIAREKTETNARLAALTREKAETDARLDMLDARSRNLASSTDQLVRETNTLTSSGKQLSDGLDALSASLEASLQDLGKRADVSESELASLTAQVEQMEAASEELDSRTATLVRRSLELEETDKRLAEETDALKERIGKIEPRQQALEATARKLIQDTDRLTGKADQLTDRFHKGAWMTGGALLVLTIALAVTGWLNSSKIEGVRTDTHERIAEVRSDLSASIERLESTQPGSTTVEQQIGALQSQIDTKVANAIELEIETSELAGKVNRLTVMSEQFQNDLGAIKERVFAPDEKITDAAVDMSTLRGDAWLKVQNPDHYVIQLVSVYRKRELAQFIAQYRQYLPAGQLSYSKTVHKGKDMYVLLYGNYATFSEAVDELETLPSALQKNRPYLRSIKGVQRRMS